MSTTFANAEKLLPGVNKALLRAARQARIVAARTGTPLVFSSNGQIEKRWVNGLDDAGSREDFERYLKAVPNSEPPETDRLPDPPKS